MTDFNVSCPQCGHRVFKTSAKPQSLEDFYGAVCQQCGTAITEDDVKAQARELADKLVRDALRKAGLH